MSTEFYSNRKIPWEQFTMTAWPAGLRWGPQRWSDDERMAEGVCRSRSVQDESGATVWAYSGRAGIEDVDSTTFEIFLGSYSPAGHEVLRRIAQQFNVVIADQYGGGTVATPERVYHDYTYPEIEAVFASQRSWRVR
jgi:hypothetical protein